MSKELDYVQLSRLAAVAVQYLNSDARFEFIDAVNKCASLKEVANPYRKWIESPETIPEQYRVQRPSV